MGGEESRRLVSMEDMVRAKNRVSPVYWAMVKGRDSLTTCVVAGPNRHRTWLYVHNPTPTVLRLHSDVIVFLRDVLEQVAHGPTEGNEVWRLPKNTQLSHPECLVVRAGEVVSLHVLAATPTAVHLAPITVKFLSDVLAQLPVIGQRQAELADLHSNVRQLNS